MPGHRHRASQGYYTDPVVIQGHQIPLSTAEQQSLSYYGDLASANMQPQSLQPPNYATGGPVQQPQSIQSYQPMPQQAMPTRPSSGAWSQVDDQTLMQARSQGMNWAPIQQNYFPNKTPNACRKRHERLMERRNADDWDTIKLENLAKTYMGMRREIWSPLAAQTGEKWNVVEQKCMSNGLKNLQTAARSATRRERMNEGLGQPTSMPPGAYAVEPPADDSSLSIDELEAEYDADGTSSTHSGGSVGIGMSGVPQAHYGTHHPGHHQQHHHHQGGHQQYHHQQRLPSLDMGIDAIINRPNRSSSGR
ncbi:hypothetical protein B7463_g2530, partial [Scytalidium lignicola]